MDDKTLASIHAEAAVTVPQQSQLEKFVPLYRATVRPVLLSVIALLKLFHRGDAANAVAQTISFLDFVTGGGPVI
jgi:hypothetical protein